jgi:hypothetical protein
MEDRLAAVSAVHLPSASVDQVPPRPRLLTSQQLADKLGMSVRSVQRWRTKGWITPTFVTPAGHTRWDEDTVREQIEQVKEQIARDDDGE